MFTRSVRATRSEQVRVLPGDELIPDPIAARTHAITIRCPARDVWPWLAQMGAGSRAGWYSYDCLDNSLVPSAMHIIPGLQKLALGMVMPALPDITDSFTILAYKPQRFLVIGWTDKDGPLMTWAFVLKETANAATRLIVRARGSRRYHFHRVPGWMAKRFIPVVHFIMQRKQLLGIAWRAERAERLDPTSARHPAH